jgi:hypothetical protein
MSWVLRLLGATGLRTSGLLNNYVKPIWTHNQLRAWWRRGRPAPAPHGVKLATILHWADLIGATTLVETGTFRGDTVRALRGRFDRLISIELSPRLATPVVNEHRAFKNVEIVVGDSGAKLPQIAPSLTTPTIFWLDAHYSAGKTVGEGVVPVYRELAGAWATSAPHVILIDDMRDFNGANGYPTVEDLTARFEAKAYKVFIANDILQAIPRTLL